MAWLNRTLSNFPGEWPDPGGPLRLSRMGSGAAAFPIHATSPRPSPALLSTVPAAGERPFPRCDSLWSGAKDCLRAPGWPPTRPLRTRTTCLPGQWGTGQGARASPSCSAEKGSEALCLGSLMPPSSAQNQELPRGSWLDPRFPLPRCHRDTPVDSQSPRSRLASSTEMSRVQGTAGR